MGGALPAGNAVGPDHVVGEDVRLQDWKLSAHPLEDARPRAAQDGVGDLDAALVAPFRSSGDEAVPQLQIGGAELVEEGGLLLLRRTEKLVEAALGGVVVAPEPGPPASRTVRTQTGGRLLG